MKGYAGNRTVDMELTTLSNAFLWACRKELVRSNPMSVYRPRYCSDKNIRHCREFMPNDADELHRIAELMFASLRSDTLGWQLLVEAATGLRTVEALKLRTDAKPYQPGWITPDGKSLYVWRAKNQQAVNPFVLIHEGLAAVLKAHKRWKDERFPDSPWYFPSYKNTDNCVDNCALGQSLRQRREILGRKITSHGLRAFYVTNRRSHGIPDVQIAWEIGHTSGGQTLAAVYGGAPPHWLAGDGPKMAWLPTGQPAWEKRWPQWMVELVHEMLHEYDKKIVKIASPEGIALFGTSTTRFQNHPPDDSRFFTAIAERARYFNISPKELLAHI